MAMALAMAVPMAITVFAQSPRDWPRTIHCLCMRKATPIQAKRLSAFVANATTLKRAWSLWGCPQHFPLLFTGR
eukprot:8774951-Alexandrium_andersonii.AAC.1